MKKFQIIPHVADIRLYVQANSLRELFEAVIQGMNEIIKKGFCKKLRKGSISRKIDINSTDQTSLLIDFLSEVLTLSQIEKAIFCQVEIDNLKDNHIKAKVNGAKVENFDEDIKAVSYHEADVKQDKNGNWETTIVFDI